MLTMEKRMSKLVDDVVKYISSTLVKGTW